MIVFRFRLTLKAVVECIISAFMIPTVKEFMQ